MVMHIYAHIRLCYTLGYCHDGCLMPAPYSASVPFVISHFQ